MRFPLTLITTLLLAPLAALHAAEATAKPAGGKPNLIVIFTDDHDWADLGAQGVDKNIRTPNVDRLARDGVRFTRGYVTAPQCTPSRAGLISGRYQNKLGVEQNFNPVLDWREKRTAAPDALLALGGSGRDPRVPV